MRLARDLRDEELLRTPPVSQARYRSCTVRRFFAVEFYVSQLAPNLLNLQFWLAAMVGQVKHVRNFIIELFQTRLIRNTTTIKSYE